MAINIEDYAGDITPNMMALLLMADPNEDEVLSYIKDGNVLVSTMAGKVLGIAVLGQHDDVFELQNIAVDGMHQNKGIAKKLITAVKNKAKALGAQYLNVATGNSSLSQLGLYQKCGFRLQSIEADYFLRYPDVIYENGIQCLDRVLLRAEL